MVCKNCNKNDAKKYSKYSSGEFCSKSCACSFSTKEKRAIINDKVSSKLKGLPSINIGSVIINGKRIRNPNSDILAKKYNDRKEYVRNFQKKKISTIIFPETLKIEKMKPRFCKVCNKEISYQAMYEYCRNHIGHSEEYRNKLKHKKKDSSNMGGPRHGGGKSKVYEYVNLFNEKMMLNKDEIEIAKCLDLLKIKWCRNWKGFSYIDLDGKNRKYYPDFYSIEYDYYIEYKGYVTKKMKHKMENSLKGNNFKLLIIYSDDKRYCNLGLNMNEVKNNPEKILEYMIN
jgi:hypothetical protein